MVKSINDAFVAQIWHPVKRNALGTLGVTATLGNFGKEVTFVKLQQPQVALPLVVTFRNTGNTGIQETLGSSPLIQLVALQHALLAVLSNNWENSKQGSNVIIICFSNIVIA